MVKTITIRDDVYRKLLAVKKKNEGFSDLFDRLAENKTPSETLMKLRATVDFRQKEKLLSELYSLRQEKECK